MDLTKLVAISGMSGIFEVISNKDNGLVVRDFINDKKKFVSARKYQFTPFESISIYTYDDSVPLAEVFEKMLKYKEENEIPSPKAKNNELREFFDGIVSDHDKDRVYISDIKKLIKWFNFMVAQDLFTKFAGDPEPEKETEETKPKED